MESYETSHTHSWHHSRQIYGLRFLPDGATFRVRSTFRTCFSDSVNEECGRRTTTERRYSMNVSNSDNEKSKSRRITNGKPKWTGMGGDAQRGGRPLGRSKLRQPRRYKPKNADFLANFRILISKKCWGISVPGWRCVSKPWSSSNICEI